jgi:hypothetical protein
MIIYSWPWGYRRSYFWLPGLYSVTLAVWVLFVWPFILVFWMAVWGFALVGWIIAEFYLLLFALGIMAWVGWIHRRPFELYVKRPWSIPLWAVIVEELD